MCEENQVASREPCLVTNKHDGRAPEREGVMRVAILIIILWFLVGYIPGVGFMNAQYKNKYPAVYDKQTCGYCYSTAIFAGPLGPLGFLLAYTMSGFAEYGFDMSCKEVQSA